MILPSPHQERIFISVINPELFCKNNRKRERRGNKLNALPPTSLIYPIFNKNYVTLLKFHWPGYKIAKTNSLNEAFVYSLFPRITLGSNQGMYTSAGHLVNINLFYGFLSFYLTVVP